MCIATHKLFKCGCKELQHHDSCPMIDRALWLVDEHGMSEEDSRIRNLEHQCYDKSADRYEIRSEYCDACKACIAAIGIEDWLVVKGRCEAEEESAWLAELKEEDAAEVGASVSESAVLVMNQPAGKEIQLEDKRNDPVNPLELNAALTTLLTTGISGVKKASRAKQISTADYYAGGDVYNPADYATPVALSKGNGEGSSTRG